MFEDITKEPLKISKPKKIHYNASEILRESLLDDHPMSLTQSKDKVERMEQMLGQLEFITLNAIDRKGNVHITPDELINNLFDTIKYIMWGKIPPEVKKTRSNLTQRPLKNV